MKKQKAGHQHWQMVHQGKRRTARLWSEKHEASRSTQQIHARTSVTIEPRSGQLKKGGRQKSRPRTFTNKRWVKKRGKKSGKTSQVGDFSTWGREQLSVQGR